MVYFEKTFQPNKKDIPETLKRDFHDKCYLCEDKVDSRYFEIEHFLPKKPKGSKKENVIRKNSWDNLMLACSDCNKHKGNMEPILNPTLANEKIDEKICFRIVFDNNATNGSKIVIDGVVEQVDSKTANTIELLKKIHNGENGWAKIKSADLREKIYDEIAKFDDFIRRYRLTEKQQRKDELLQSIIEGLSNRTPFTAFKRWWVKEKSEYQDFIQYIKD